VTAVALQEEYASMRIDEALRKLLREFKLPGEAQQIDRIMEKFAEAYCKHNPGSFRAAEDAYRLAFAIIMLNTDVHNPLADHMLSKQTFVDMNSDVNEDGKAVPALPVDELHGIFDRVSAQVGIFASPTVEMQSLQHVLVQPTVAALIIEPLGVFSTGKRPEAY
jgi:Sec7-like guanine-nucleotide exchange factor